MQMSPLLVQKISEAGLAPGVAARLEGDVILGSDDPSHDVASRRLDNWHVGILRHQPVRILVLELRLENGPLGEERATEELLNWWSKENPTAK